VQLKSGKSNDKKRFLSFAFVAVSGVLGAYSAVATAAGNHLFAKVIIPSTVVHPDELCSYQFSPVNFCDKEHLDVINAAIASRAPDFSAHYIVLPKNVQEDPQFHRRSLAILDANTGLVYPLPIDFYSGRLTRMAM
jgi:hypothetical protein